MIRKFIPFFVLFFISCSSQKPEIITSKTPRKKISIAKVLNKKTVPPTIVTKQDSNPAQLAAKTTKLQEIKVPIDTVKQTTANEQSSNTFASIAKDTSKIIKDYDGIIKTIKTNGADAFEDTSPKKKPLNLGAVQVLAATTTVKVTKQVVLDYIEKYKEYAKTEMLKYRIPASITLAQGILESGAGTGPLCMQANNHFGIKCHESWTGESVRYDDDIPDECFRKYDDPKKSFQDHSAFLFTRPWYNGLFKLKQDDYKGWARGLKAAGYATDIKYPEKLIGIIQTYNLTQYDTEVMVMQYGETLTTPPVTNAAKALEKVVEQPEETFTETVVIATDTNNTTTYIVQAKEGLYSIAKKFNTTVDALKKLNDLKDNNISIGQVLKIK